jgi:hypothetical protein
VEPDLFEPAYDRISGSVIFDFSAESLARFRASFSQAILGGTGAGAPLLQLTVEEVIGRAYEHYDYSDYPDVEESMGFTQRGCRLNCGFCSVRRKEGRPRSVYAIGDIWRGPPWPKRLRLIDNDFFGQPRAQWQARIGGFRVNITQGINIRLLGEEAAEALASIEYRDSKFERRKLYTAWDNLKDENVFFEGVARLERAGVRRPICASTCSSATTRPKPGHASSTASSEWPRSVSNHSSWSTIERGSTCGPFSGG